MYFFVDILGKQYKIFKNKKIKIDKINSSKNSFIILNKILIFISKKIFIINKNFLNKIILIARISGHYNYKKLKILKFKRRKGYLKNIGFKKKYTEIILEEINLNLLNFYYGSKKIWRFF